MCALRSLHSPRAFAGGGGLPQPSFVLLRGGCYFSLRGVKAFRFQLFFIWFCVLCGGFEALLAQSSGRERIGESAGNVGMPAINLRSPTTDSFFRGGKRIFPANFQAPAAAARTGTGAESFLQATGAYPVGPGDQFLINFWGRIEDNLLVTINSDDKLFIPRLGAIDVKGLRYEDLENAVTKRITASLKDVQFTMSLFKPREFKIYVLGAARKPGPSRAQATMRASDVIEAAGGMAATGSQQYIEIRRVGEAAPLRVDLLRYRSFGDFSMNPFVTDEDVIFIPNLREFVTVTGAVIDPGTFEIKETKKLSDVLGQLGGLSVYADRTAPLRLSRLQEDGSRRQLQIAQSESNREKDQPLISEVELQNGDEIFVPSGNLLIPSQSNQVFVTGEVKAPGAKAYQISMNAEEYIGMAGGLTSRANLSGAVVYKADGSSIKLGPRTSIEPGDTLYIPEKTFKFWQDHLTIVTTFISRATSIIVLSSR